MLTDLATTPIAETLRRLSAERLSGNRVGETEPLQFVEIGFGDVAVRVRSTDPTRHLVECRRGCARAAKG